MAVTHKIYNKHFTTLYNKETDGDSDTFKCALTTSTYAVSQTAHDYFNDVTNEVSSTNYSAGGVSIGSLTVAYASQVLGLDATDAAWTTVSFTTRYGVTYDSTPGTAATNPLFTYVDFGADQTVSSANFSIVWAAAGLVSLTVA